MFCTKEINRLYYDDLMSSGEVSELLGCSKSLVRDRLYREMRTREEAGRIRTIKCYYGYMPKVFKDMYKENRNI